MENFRQRFTPTNNDLSYYPLLFLALEETKDGDVIEMGTGYGSTQLLHDYCKGKRWLFSYEEKQEWMDKFMHLHGNRHYVGFVTGWDKIKNRHCASELPTVVFIDHAPGERRKDDIVNFKDIPGILVVHDTEPAADYGYQMRQHFKLFKYVIEIQTDGAWATALSNSYDVTKWAGQEFGKYKIG